MAAYKMLNTDEIKKLSPKDLNAEIAKSETDLAKRRIKVRLGEDKQNHMVGAVKKYIARLKTPIVNNTKK
ncbi:MAG: 50S ribosomal protein L29 [Patescibacteria group bacterium]